MKFIRKGIACVLAIAIVITNISVREISTVEAATSKITSSHFLKANGKYLKNNYGKGETVYLRGTNAGGYMIQETWMCPTSSSTNVSDQTDIINTLTSKFGSQMAKTLIDTYEENYWTEADFDNCANLRINCLRLPVWYRNFVDENNNWYPDAFDRIDWFIEEAGERGIYVIIDMHGAYGSQNGSDNSGVDGGDDKLGASEFFFGDNAAANQEKYYKMWEKIAAHYAGNPVVAGYDLLNEPYNTYRYSSGYTNEYLRELLWGIYDTAYDRIRAVDADHLIIMEATWDPEDLPDPTKMYWTNVMYEYHNYLYSDYDDETKQVANMQSKIDKINAANYSVPSYIGEFNYMSNDSTWNTGLKLLNDNNLNWTSWSYKCIPKFGNWGLYNNSSSLEYVNVESDNYDTILAKWSAVGESTENTGVTQYFKKYTPGTVSGLSTVTVPDVTDAAAVGGEETLEIDFTTLEDMPYYTQYYVYLDDSTEPLQVFNPRIEAEEWSEQSGVAYDSNKTDSEGNTINNVGGTHNGDWTKYNDIDFGDGTAYEMTARYSVAYSGSGSNPKIEVYVDSMDSSNLVGTMKFVKVSGEGWENYKLGTVVLDTPITGKHDIYIKYVVDGSSNVCNLDWFQFSAQPVNNFRISLDDVAVGKHTVTIKTYANGQFSSGKVISDVNVRNKVYLYSDSVGVEGFQIRTNKTEDSVAYRAICKAPNVGSVITVDGSDYTVEDVGTIYAIDTDYSGDVDNSQVDGSVYTLLDPTAVDSEVEEANGYKYVGENLYNGSNRTYGYIATDEGIISSTETTDTENTYYVRTMEGMDELMEYTLHVRAFVTALDADGSRVFVYGDSVADVSVAEIAHYIYVKSLSSNYRGHDYLYDNILSKISTTNPFYMSTTINYGWNDNLYTPDVPSIPDVSLSEYVKTDTITASATAANDTEGPDKLFDSNTRTKYCTKGSDQAFPFTIHWEMDSAVTIRSYALTTGNDTSRNSNRNPKSWKLYGSTDGSSWKELDSVESGGMEAKDYEAYTYTVDVEGAYQYFKLEIISSEGSTEKGQIQLSEISLQGYVSE